MSPDPAFADLMDRLRAGDEDAAARVFDRFTRGLIRLAQRQFEPSLRPRADPEGVVQSVYRSFFRRVRDGEFDLLSWDSLWGLLTVITLRKCANRLKRLRRQRRDAYREVPLELPGASGRGSPAWEALAHDPTPSEAAILA